MKLCRSKAEEKSVLEDGDDDNAATAQFHRSTWLIIKLFDYKYAIRLKKRAVYQKNENSPKNMLQYNHSKGNEKKIP